METVPVILEQIRGSDPTTGEAVVDKIEGAVRTDGETVVLDLPRGGEWATGNIDLIRALVAALPDP